MTEYKEYHSNRDVISLFSGAMGLDIGLQEAGLNVAIGQDFEPACVKTMSANGHNVLGGDIRDIHPQTLLDMTGLNVGEPFMICGGPPCQPFSTAGKRLGINDPRGSLFMDFIRMIDYIRPRFFVMENVRGMATRIDEIVDNFRMALGDEYSFAYALLNAADFGIPQNRLRLYVIGIRKDLKIDYPFTFPAPQVLKTTVKDYLLKDPIPVKYYLGKKGFEFVTTHPTRAKVGSPIMNCQKATQQFNWNGDFIFEPFDSARHTPEILKKAYIGEFKGERGVVRMFTPRECLRLMGFPDSFKIVVNDNLMWRQAGNSIVVNVLEALMKQLIKTGVFETR